MGLETHLRYELKKIGLEYGNDYIVDNGELKLDTNNRQEKGRIVRFLRKTKEFNPVMRGNKIILEPMPWAGGKKR